MSEETSTIEQAITDPEILEKPKRKKKAKEPEIQEADKSGPSAMTEINNLMSSYKEDFSVKEEPLPELEKKRGRPKKGFEQKSIQADPIITGSLLILLIDMVLPNALSFGNNLLSKKKIKSSDLMLSNEQKKELEPIAEAAAQQMMLKGNPVTMLIVCLLAMYGVKLMSLKVE